MREKEEKNRDIKKTSERDHFYIKPGILSMQCVTFFRTLKPMKKSISY